MFHTMMKGAIVMETALNNNPTDLAREDENLLRLLDRGIDDMENERELPVEEAFDKITELRNVRRNARV